MPRRIGFPDAFRDLGEELIYFDPAWDVPERFSPRGRWKGEGSMHTFCDDYRQEFFWRRPWEGLVVAISSGVVTAPDFTVYTNDPPEWRRYQAWRSALIARFWQSHGANVIPVISFGSGCHEYVRTGSVWAVRGSIDPQWSENFRRWIDQALPACVYVFGRMPEGDFGIPLHQRRLVSSKVC